MAHVGVKRVLRAFLASPGDLPAEREAVREAIDEVNASLTPMLDWELEVVGWEETEPGYGRPQARINKDVDRCHVFIGILGSRWGSPTGVEDSGFFEEFQRAKQRCEQEGAPDIWLFFRRLPEAAVTDPGPQLQRVIDFRKQVEGEKQFLFKTFDDPEGLSALIRRSASRIVLRHAMSQIREPLPSAAQPPSSTSSQALSPGLSGIPTGFIDLDQLTRGLSLGTLVVVSGSGEGVASTFASNVALFNASVPGRVVGQFTPRMLREQTITQHLVSLTRIDIERVQSGYLRTSEWEKLTAALEQLGGCELRIEDNPQLSLDLLISESNRLRELGAPSLIVIDSLEQVKDAGTAAVALHTLKGLANTLNAVVLVVSGSFACGHVEVPAVDYALDINMNWEDSIAQVAVVHSGRELGRLELAYIPSYARFENYDPAPV